MYDPKLEALVHSKYLFERAEAVKQDYRAIDGLSL